MYSHTLPLNLQTAVNKPGAGSKKKKNELHFDLLIGWEYSHFLLVSAKKKKREREREITQKSSTVSRDEEREHVLLRWKTMRG